KPTSGDTLIFNNAGGSKAAMNNDTGNGNTFTVVLDGATGYALSGNSIVLAGLSFVNGDATVRSNSISNNLALPSNLLIDVSGTGAPLTLSSTLSDTGGTFGITKAGAGKLVLAGASSNTFGGNVTVNAGELDLGKSAGSNAIAASLIIGDGSNPATVKY